MRRTLRLGLALIALILAAAAPQPVGAGSGSLRADLEGTSIPMSEVASYHCHDLDYPVIHCFLTEDELQSAMVLSTMAEASGPIPLGSNYIELFDLVGYAGASIYLSADYPSLGTLGWNDRASSYIAQNGLDSALYVETNYQGSALYPCCNQLVPSLSGTFNDKISSARQR
jgi:Peptidase inhibitor family I36